MIILGLTGSIGMGKSTTANLFKEQGAPVFDADAAVAQMYQPGGDAVPLIEHAFPGCTSEAAGVDRAKLTAALQADPSKFETLNAIVHPLVGAARRRFFMRLNRPVRRLWCWMCRSCSRPVSMTRCTMWWWSPRPKQSNVNVCWRGRA